MCPGEGDVGGGEASLQKREELIELFLQGGNRLFLGDCLAVMRVLPSASIDLIYIDPPFFSGRTHSVALRGRPAPQGHPSAGSGAAGGEETRFFSDTWSGGLPGYLVWLTLRLDEMRRLLKPTGSIYVHLDWHAVHYVKVEMDRIFGIENFRNEIVWHYGGRGAKAIANQFPRNHDTILVYSRSAGSQVFHRQYMSRVLTEAGAQGRGYRRGTDGRWFKTSPRGDYTDASLRSLDAGGRVHRTKNGGVRIKYFLESEGGLVAERVPVGDTWWDIPDAMHMPRIERMGYPAQKPEALLTRIIRASSDEGGVVADFFCGAGTTCAVAQKLGRLWIGCDISRAAVVLTAHRLARLMRNSKCEIQEGASPRVKRGGRGVPNPPGD